MVPLRATIRTKPEKHVQPARTAQIEEMPQVAVAGKVVNVTLWFMPIPEDVAGNGVDAAFEGAVQDAVPLRTRRPGVMDFAANQELPATIPQKRMLIVGKHSRRADVCFR